MREAYIVSSVRTPGCRRGRGALQDTRPEELIAFILKAAVEKAQGVQLKDIDDITLGCAFPEAEQGLNLGRIAAQIAGFPDEVSGMTVNRFCSSGLEAIAISAMRIMSGWADVCISGGCESMTYVPMGGNIPRPNPEYSKKHPQLYMGMGLTAENVAKRYGISRQMQDEYAYHSHMKAVKAQEKNDFDEIIPTPAVKYVKTPSGTYKKETFIQKIDDGVRADTTIEGLAKLRPAFAADGTVTAGNSSQTTDGAAATLIMSEEKVKQFGLKPIAKLKLYTTIGCKADEMGVGPAYAIPKLLKMAGLKVDDIGLWEVNEAFASQFIYCCQQLGTWKKENWAADSDKRTININGGAIALGHPLGCTGAKLAATLLNNMKKKGVKYGVESMCIGGGMGAAALFELCE